jgi:hypothetical protein
MLIGGAAILAVLLVAGIDFRRALQWAVALACPVMMIGMMVMMNRKGGTHRHGSSEGETGSRVVDADPGARAPKQTSRLS